MNFISLVIMVSLCHADPIVYAARKYGVDLNTMRAIAQVESSGGIDKRINYNTNGTHDTGLFQINSVHKSGVCKGMNLADDWQNAECAAILLRSARRHALTDPLWVGRYHSKTPRLKRAYALKIERLKREVKN